MSSLDAATAERWMRTAVPYAVYNLGLIAVWTFGLVNWLAADSASWIPLLIGAAALVVQLGAPRAGWAAGVTCGLAALVVEREPSVLAGWVALGTASAGLLVWSAVGRSRQRAISHGLSHGRGLQVVIAFDDDGKLAVFPVGHLAAHPVAYADVEPDETALEAAVAAVDPADHPDLDDLDLQLRVSAGLLRPHMGPAVLIGELVEGTWPEFATAAGRLRASGRLRARRWHEKFKAAPTLDLKLPATAAKRAEPAVSAPPELPALPWRPGLATGFDRWSWIGAVPLGVMSVGAADAWFTRGAVSWRLFAVLPFAIGLYAMIQSLCRSLTIAEDGVRIRGPLTERRASWGAVRSVRRDGGKVVLDLGPAGGVHELRFDGKDGRPTATQVAAAAAAARARRPAIRPTTRRPFWGTGLLILYVAGLVTAAVFVIGRL